MFCFDFVNDRCDKISGVRWKKIIDISDECFYFDRHIVEQDQQEDYEYFHAMKK